MVVPAGLPRRGLRGRADGPPAAVGQLRRARAALGHRVSCSIPTRPGLKPVTVDQYLRTEYDRVPEPPPRGPRGADRIKILEDTDGDGRADKATVFVEGLNLASGLAVGHGGVFVGQAPYLLFYPDQNRDDRPDGDPEVLLTGFGLQDAHATVNSLTWGPDGWLYGAQGSTVTARIRGIEFQQGIWRYHPRTRQFELFAEGGGNTWGLDFDAAGQRLRQQQRSLHHVPHGPGRILRQGVRQAWPAAQSRTPTAISARSPTTEPSSAATSRRAGSSTRAMRFPPRFRGAFIGGNLLSNAVYWHVLERDGSTFAGRHGGTLIDARDRWFRPIDLLVGPDAAVYVVDWYDKRAAHLDPRDTWDRTNGRIYRVVYGERRKVAPFDLAQTLECRAGRAADQHQRLVRRRGAANPGRAARPVGRAGASKSDLRSRSDETVALRDLWALDRQRRPRRRARPSSLLGHPRCRRATLDDPLLGDEHRMNGGLRPSLVDAGGRASPTRWCGASSRRAASAGRPAMLCRSWTA